MKREQFWRSTTEQGDCWVWTGRTNAYGYGVVTFDGELPRNRIASRVSQEWARGPIPKGVHVPHACDNPPCVNPEHLWLGTHRQNMADKVAKRRHNFGSRHGFNKLDEVRVAEIRSRHNAGGVKQSELAVEYGVSQITISRVVRHLTWTHVDSQDQMNGRPA